MKFERFSDGARQVVVRAQEQARALADDEIRAEHLLLAVLDAQGSPAAAALTQLGVQRGRLVELVRRLGGGDEQALRDLGIDLSARDRDAAAIALRRLGVDVGELRRRVTATLQQAA